MKKILLYRTVRMTTMGFIVSEVTKKFNSKDITIISRPESKISMKMIKYVKNVGLLWKTKNDMEYDLQYYNNKPIVHMDNIIVRNTINDENVLLALNKNIFIIVKLQLNTRP